jgi:hypothetical protein
MQKKEIKKLRLHRETLQTLEPGKLAGAAGGATAACTFQYTNCHCTFECTGACA